MLPYPGDPPAAGTVFSQGMWSQPAVRVGPLSRSALAQCRRQSEGTCSVAEGTTPGLAACSVGGSGEKENGMIERENRKRKDGYKQYWRR